MNASGELSGGAKPQTTIVKLFADQFDAQRIDVKRNIIVYFNGADLLKRGKHRFRRRIALSISAHAPNFLLKGTLLFSLWYDLPHRPTRDADLLGFGPDDIDSAVTTFREICQIQ